MPLPPGTSIDDIKIRIKESYTNPNVGQVFQVVLKEGPRVFRIATLLEIVEGPARQFHHYSLKLDSIDRRRNGWFARPERSIRLDGSEPDEIERLYRFLKVLFDGKLVNKSGDLRIIGSQDYHALTELLTALPKLAATDKLELLKVTLARLDAPDFDVRQFVDAFQAGDLRTVGHIGAAAKIVQYQAAYDRLKELIEDEQTGEQILQKHLAENPWMFGSEYSELLDRRAWTRDDRLDYMLRRTVDGFLEIVEIKTPFRESLLQHDRSHDCYYPSAKLSGVIGQAMRYIEEVERNRDSIISKDGVDPLKIRVRIIAGRDGSVAHQAALRNLNAHLHRLEVITFDQLLRICGRVLAVFQSVGRAEPVSDEDDIPF